MQFFTTEMIFTHPPRSIAGLYASPRRRRYGCRTMPPLAAAARDAHVGTQAVDMPVQAPAGTDASEALIIDEAA